MIAIGTDIFSKRLFCVSIRDTFYWIQNVSANECIFTQICMIQKSLTIFF
jgi:hypothetical protein